MTDEMYEAVQRENAWDDEACGDGIARVDVVDDVCGVVIHFIEVRNADENRRVLRPGARWLVDRDGKNEWGCNSSRSMRPPLGETH